MTRHTFKSRTVQRGTFAAAAGREVTYSICTRCGMSDGFAELTGTPCDPPPVVYVAGSAAALAARFDPPEDAADEN